MKKQYVLVHGGCHGAWCWYKVKPMLEHSGHHVTAVDLTSSGVNMTKVEEIQTLEDYAKPLLEVLESFGSDDKVILVAHSLGGISAAFAADMFPLTVKLEQKPPGKSTKFKACIILGGEGDWECVGAYVCCSITSGGNALTACYKEITPVYLGHLYTFEVEVETEEVTSTELAFEFDLSYTEVVEAAPNGRPSCYEQRTFKTLEVKECGILQLLEVPLLNFTDVLGDY